MNRSIITRTLLAAAVTLAIGGVGLAGCSSPSQAPSSSPTEAESEPSSPALSLLYTTEDEGLVLHDAAADTSRTLVPGARHDGVRARSPSDRYLAFTYTAADTTHLAALNLRTQTMRTVDRRPASATYSLAWHPEEDRLAFAYYEPTESGTRGPGDIFVTAPDASPRNVGCSAAREVLHWLPDGSLATRNDEKLYLVAPSDCATRAAGDAQRMHHATYAPSGTHLAYVHRELTYDQDAHEYTPDSSLFVSNDRGQNAEKLFGFERRVRHLAWAPDGSELAFDAYTDASGHRQVATYRPANDRTVYVTPPEQTVGDQVHPRWSPSGTILAFTLRTDGGPTAAVRTQGQTRRYGPVETAVWGWLDDRTLIVPGPDSLRVEPLDGDTRFTHPSPATLLHVWSRNPA